MRRARPPCQERRRARHRKGAEEEGVPGEAGAEGGEERRKARRLELAAARGSRRGAPGDAREDQARDTPQERRKRKEGGRRLNVCRGTQSWARPNRMYAPGRCGDVSPAGLSSATRPGHDSLHLEPVRTLTPRGFRPLFLGRSFRSTSSWVLGFPSPRLPPRAHAVTKIRT